MDREELNKLKYLIDKRKSLEEICIIMTKEPYRIYEMVMYLKHMGQNYDIIDGIPQKVDATGESFVPRNFHISQVEKICLLADPHYGSIYDRPDIMDYIYGRCENEGITSIFCAGDFTDGYYPRRPQLTKEQKVHGTKAMVNYVAHTHPYSKYITFYTIGGNHDKSFTNYDGVSIIREISKVRPDIVYMGQDEANIILGNLSMQMFHGYGSKVLDTRIKNYYYHQDYQNPPDIIQLGHIHRFAYRQIDATHFLQCGCIMDFRPFEQKDHQKGDQSCIFVSFVFDEESQVWQIDYELEVFDTNRTRRKKY